MNRKKEVLSHKNNTIEFLRLIFSMCIVLFHGTESWPFPVLFGKIALFRNGAVAVEFFFLVSGFLLAKKADRRIFSDKNQPAKIGTETVRIISKKLLYIFPYHLYAYVVSFLLIIFIQHLTVRQALRLFIDSLPNLFLLDMTGIRYTMVNGFEWYISAMLISIFLIYPFLLYDFDLTTKVIAPLFSILILGWISHSYGTTASVTVWTGLVYKGVLRGVAVMLLGCMAYALQQKICKLHFTRIGIVMLTILEWSFYFLTVLYICTNESDSYYIYIAILLAISVAITFSEKSLSFNLFKMDLQILGKISLALWLNQWHTKLFVEYFMTSLTETWRLILYVPLTIINGIICLIVVDFFKKRVRPEWVLEIDKDNIK